MAEKKCVHRVRRKAWEYRAPVYWQCYEVCRCGACRLVEEWQTYDADAKPVIRRQAGEWFYPLGGW